VVFFPVFGNLTEEYQKLIKIVEPYEYRDRLTLPKLLINATGDQFFLPDSHRFYFDDLQGPTYTRYIPNADHSLSDTDAPETLAAWHLAIAHGKPLPTFDWDIDWKRGEITVQLEDRPEQILLWQASNENARDFRQETIGNVWSKTDVVVDSTDTVRVRLSKPKKGWKAFLLELTYRIDGVDVPLKLTTGVAVVPDIKPFAGKLPVSNPTR